MLLLSSCINSTHYNRVGLRVLEEKVCFFGRHIILFVNPSACWGNKAGVCQMILAGSRSTSLIGRALLEEEEMWRISTNLWCESFRGI